MLRYFWQAIFIFAGMTPLLAQSTDNSEVSDFYGNPNPRLSMTLRYDRWGYPAGIDPSAPGSRFSLSSPSSPGRKRVSTPNDIAVTLPSQELPAYHSFNRPMIGDTTPFTPPEIKRPPSFFERVETFAAADGDTAASMESLPILSRSRPRWFRETPQRANPYGQPPMPRDSQNTESGPAVAVGSARAGGGQSAMPQNPPNISPIRNMQAEQQAIADAKRRYEEKLEGMLLTNPTVHLLSPVQVSFENGIATVRGTVTNQENKVAAGNVLLTDPAVKQVNNMISVLP